MAVMLKELIAEAETLSPQEQAALIRAVSQFLGRTHHEQRSATDFWQPQSIDQLVASQAIQPVEDIAYLASDEFGDETADEMIEYIYAQRDGDRSRAA